MRDRPGVSVIIVTHNSADHLGECLDSIFCQTLDGIEVIAVDVLSTDGTKDILAEDASENENFILLTDKWGSMGHAKNIALDHARAPYVVFVEPDDYIDRRMLERLYSHLEENPDVDMVSCEIDSFGGDSYGRTNKDKTERLAKLQKADGRKPQLCARLIYWQIFECSMMFRKSFLDDNGMRFYEEPGYGRQDVAFRFRSLVNGQFSLLSMILYYRRLEAPREFFDDTRVIGDLSSEYRHLKMWLQENPSQWWQTRYIFWQAYYRSNMELYGVLSENLKPVLTKRMQAELMRALRNREVSRERLAASTKDIEILLRSANAFDERQKEKMLERKKKMNEFRQREAREVWADEIFAEQNNDIQVVQELENEIPSMEADERLDRKQLIDEMGRDMAPLRLLLGLSQEEMSNILGVPVSTYKSLEAGKKDVSWDQYLALIFLFTYNKRTAAVTDTLGLYPEVLKLRMKKGIVGNIYV